ncbi:MAG: glycoside hydrolase family 5 protein [Monoglobaceae bacterium]
MKYIKCTTGFFVKILIALLLLECSVSAEFLSEIDDISISSADKAVSEEFFRYPSNKIAASVKYNEDITGSVAFALYDEGRLIDVNMQGITADGGNEYTFKNCTDTQVIKIFFFKDTNKFAPTQDFICKNTCDIEAPDVIKVNSDGYLAKNDGEVIQLKGVNFGGWLLQETWMCPVLAFNADITVKNGTENGWANLDTLDKMEELFGKDETAKLINSYQDNYITEWDFENVKNMGFNCIRIPFWYRNFMSDEIGTYITENDDDNPGFQRLDWACDMADKYGLYLILDMHGCPGGQNGDHSCGKVGRNYLYKEENYQDIMEELWCRIADRYKNRACVAAYDIMNEPFNNADAAHNVQSTYIANVWDNGDTNKLRVNVYDRMLKAIREVDPYHVITVEGIWRLYLLPKPSEYGWTNVMYQLHSYDADDNTTSSLVTSIDNYRKSYKVAGLMGEFNPAVYNNTIVNLMNEKGISYTMWNYKATAVFGGNNSSWGLYHREYEYNDEMIKICSNNYTVLNSINSTWSSSGSIMFHLDNLTTAQKKQFYTNWWTKEYLSTENFELNSTLSGYLK